MKLSIITVNLNNEPGLKKTFESVIAQSFTDYEWIVIDGGSVDGSAGLIEKYADRFTFRISEPDTGIYNAMNKGILKAGGEYCFFLNSGDYFINGEVLKNFFSARFSEDVVSGNMFVITNGSITEKCKGKNDLTFLDLYLSLIKHQATFIKRELFQKFGLYNESLKIVADYEFFIKTVGFGGASYRYVNLDLTCFDNGGISNRNPSLVKEEKEKIKIRYIPSIMRQDYDLLVRYRNIMFVDRYVILSLFQRILGKTAKLISGKG